MDETVFTIKDILAAAEKNGVKLNVLTGESGLEHQVVEPMLNRPGLALTGYYGYFAWKRLQVFGVAEQAYLQSLDETLRTERLLALFERGAYCLIFSCEMEVPQQVVAAAQKANAVVITTPLNTRDLFRRCMFLIERLSAPKQKLYATMVEVAGLGVMMEGAPGLGKSETALGLVMHGNALVADDLTCIRKDIADNILYASAADVTKDYMEIRGIGLIHVPSIFGVSAVRGEKQIDLVITFKRMEEVNGELDRTGEDRHVREILGVKVPQLIIPVSVGRDLVNLVETAAQQFKLTQQGRNMVEELEARMFKGKKI